MENKRLDELNILSADTQDNEKEPFDYHDFILHFFDNLQITEKQRKQRIEAAEDIFDAVLLFLMWCENAPERVLEANTLRSFENMYKEVIFQYSEPDEYLDSYVPMFILNLVRTTLDHRGEEYFTSLERAAFNAVNESLTVNNHIDIENAKLLGFKNKTWVAEIDNRTREDHLNMNSWTIPIDDWFIFDDCMMRFPHDEVNGTAAQCANCRCSLTFSK